MIIYVRTRWIYPGCLQSRVKEKGAKGLDGGYENQVACRGPSPRKKAEKNTNANNELAIAA